MHETLDPRRRSVHAAPAMTPTRAADRFRPMFVLAFAAAMGVTSPPARAHGTLPTCNGITFGPGDGRVFLGTNFGGVLITPGDDPLANDFTCETLVSGSQQSIDEWVWLGSGRVVAIVSQGGFFRGVFASTPERCGYETEIYLKVLFKKRFGMTMREYRNRL